MKRKFFSIFLGLLGLFLALLMAAPVEAGSVSTLVLSSTPNVTVAEGAPFTTTVTLAGTNNVVGYQFKMYYPHDRFLLVEVASAYGNSENLVYNIQPGSLTINYTDVMNPMNGTVDLFHLTFQVVGWIPMGEPIPLLEFDYWYDNLVTVMTQDYEMYEVWDIYPAFEPVRAGIYGDVSGDGRVSILDAATIQLHLAGKKLLEPSKMAMADVNLDGNVSILDVGLIQLYLAGLREYLGPKPSYQIVMDPQNGQMPIIYQYYPGDHISLPTLYDPNRTFLGWTWDPNGTMPFDLEIMPKEHLYLYAQWGVTSTFAQGYYDFYYSSPDLRATFIAAAERYMLETMNGGIPLYSNSTHFLKSSRLVLPTNTTYGYITFGQQYGWLTQDDSNQIMTDGYFGESNEYTYRGVSAMPTSWNPWNWNQPSNEILQVTHGHLYRIYVQPGMYGYLLAPSMAIGDPVPVNPWYEENGRELASTWRITVNSNLRWTFPEGIDTTSFASDTHVLNAIDFVDTFRMVLERQWSQSSALTSTLNIVNAAEFRQGLVDWDNVGIRLIDENTFEFDSNFHWTVDELKLRLSSRNFVPVHTELAEMLLNDGIEYGLNPDAMAYSGPYLVDEFYPNQRVTLYRNPNDFASTPYHYTGFEFVNMSGQLAVDLFLAGQLDGLTVNPYVFFDQYNSAATEYRIIQNTTTWRIAINGLETIEKQRERFPNGTWVPEPILANDAFRKAMYLAIDRATIAMDIVKSQNPQATLITPAYLIDPGYGIPYRETYQGYNVMHSFDQGNYAFDPNQAALLYLVAIDDLLAQNLVTRGTIENPTWISIELRFLNSSPSNFDMTSLIETMFESLFYDNRNHIGIDLVLVPSPFPLMYSDFVSTGEFDLAIVGLSSDSNYIDSMMEAMSSNTDSGFLLNYGFDSNQAVIPVEYVDLYGVVRRELWSFDAIIAALMGETYVEQGRKVNW